jgi:hypothetical protein
MNSRGMLDESVAVAENRRRSAGDETSRLASREDTCLSPPGAIRHAGETSCRRLHDR